jgi:hypothetical protein
LNAVHTEQGLGVSSEAAIEFNQLVKSWKEKQQQIQGPGKKRALGCERTIVQQFCSAE